MMPPSSGWPLHPEDGGSMDLWHGGNLPQYHMMSQPKKPQTWNIILAEPFIILRLILYNDIQTPGDRSRANPWNTMYIKYAPNNEQCPTQY